MSNVKNRNYGTNGERGPWRIERGVWRAPKTTTIDWKFAALCVGIVAGTIVGGLVLGFVLGALIF